MTGDWRDFALCAQVGGDLHFPEQGESARPAKFVCRRCPVRLLCLDDAMHAERGCGRALRHGIFGGLGPIERDRLDATYNYGEAVA